MYTITITWLTGDQAPAVYSEVKAYEFGYGVLTLGIDSDHDIVLPLGPIKLVDIVRHAEREA